jgi:hypothetical protein
MGWYLAQMRRGEERRGEERRGERAQFNVD